MCEGFALSQNAQPVVGACQCSTGCQVTPFIFSADGTSFDALLCGGAADDCWCRNRIGLTLPEGVPLPADPDAGCDGTVAGSDCTQACREGGYGVAGFCAVPGSTDPSACCACVSG